MTEPTRVIYLREAGALIDRLTELLIDTTDPDRPTWLEVDGADVVDVVSEALNDYRTAAGLPQPDDPNVTHRDGGDVVHTSCRHCDQDIEGTAGAPDGDWRDRGNNVHCPTPAGNAGQRHAPHQDGGSR